MATGASAKMSFNFYQNGKHGTLPQNPAGKDVEVSHDMHLKMSKKIAQLTKVIYALNTKNDEHEAIVQSIKDQHEEQIQTLLAETKEKIEYYKNKLGNGSDQAKEIEMLQKCLNENQTEKQRALLDFQDYKRQTEQKELQQKTEHSQRILELTEQVAGAKREFETKLQALDSLRDRYEQDKRKAIEELTEKHRKELEETLEAQEGKEGDLISAKLALQQKHEDELQELRTKLDNLEQERGQLCVDYEGKLSKAQAFYEHELDALRNSQNANAEEQVKALQEQNDKLKKDFAFKEKQLQNQVEDLINKLSLSEEEVSNFKNELERLQNSLKDRDSSTETLAKQLEEARREATNAMTRLKETEAELIGVKDRCEHQAQDLVKKSSEIGELEATKMQHESIIRDLEAQLSRLQERLALLESAKRALESQNQAQSAEVGSQVQSLQQALEDLSIEKQKLQQKYERDTQSLEDSAKLREAQLAADHKKLVSELERKHENAMTHLRKEMELKYTSMKQELEAKLEAERSRLLKEKDAVQAEFDQVKYDLSNKLSKAEFEVRRLDKLVRDSEQGLGSATSQVSSLKTAHDRMKAELDQTRTELRNTKNKNSLLEMELDKLKRQYDAKVHEAELELKTQLDKLAKDLEAKWSDTLRKETMKLRHELAEQKEEDKKAAISQLVKMKEDEMIAMKRGWEKKVEDLLSEISSLKLRLQNASQSASSDLERVRKEAEEENRKLAQELLDSATDYGKKIESLEDMYKYKLKQLGDTKDREASALEDALKRKHIDDMQQQMGAHKITLDTVREQAEREREASVRAEHEKQKHKLDTMREEMEQRQSQELEENNRAHSQQMMAARMELERAMELSKTKEGDYAMRISDLQEEMRHREMSIRNLEEEINKLQRGVGDMSKELEMKGKEILRIRSEANQAAKAREEQLVQQQERQVNLLRADHQREAEGMLAEFSQAQDLLKDKIAELQYMLREAEERYQNRESRPEDLEAIQQLRIRVEEREALVRQMDTEKQYFQRELVNRETNFNKVFNSDPKVGVLNPFDKKKSKSKNDKAKKNSSSPSVGGRLDPMPGMPMHSGKFNQLDPIPPTKKFVR